MKEKKERKENKLGGGEGKGLEEVIKKTCDG